VTTVASAGRGSSMRNSKKPTQISRINADYLRG